MVVLGYFCVFHRLFYPQGLRGLVGTAGSTGRGGQMVTII